MRQAAQHIAAKNTVNWMGLAPSLTTAIQAGTGKAECFAYTPAVKTAG